MTLRVKDGSNIRYFIVNSVEARHKKYSFHGLNQICHYHQVSVFVNGESCEIGALPHRRASGHYR